MIDENLNVWTITNKILVVAGSAISLLVVAVAALVIMGFNAQNLKIVEGNINLSTQICELKDVLKATNISVLTLTKDVARIDANQVERINRERDTRLKNK